MPGNLAGPPLLHERRCHAANHRGLFHRESRATSVMVEWPAPDWLHAGSGIAVRR
jgi:hypothetical protein